MTDDLNPGLYEGADPTVAAIAHQLQQFIANGGQQDKVKEITWRDVTLKRVKDGQIIIPEGMSFRQAREWLKKFEDDENQTVALDYDFECFPLDGARAFWRSLKLIYGFVDTKPTFWSQTVFVQCEVAPGIFESVPWGQMAPPGMEDAVLETGFDFNGEVPKFHIGGTIKKKFLPAMDVVVARTRKFLKEESIYKGRAISVNLDFMMGKARFNIDASAPKFITFDGLTEDSLIIDETTKMLMATEIWDRIELTDKLISRGIKIKHGVAITGVYGVGKTLAAMVTAMKCVKNGWTYIYLHSADQIPVGLKFAKLFGNAVIFAEDIDRVASGERDAVMDLLFNAMDGVDNKGQNVIVVVTSNNIEGVHNGFMRAGRIDSVIEMTAPDGPTAVRFIERVGKNNLKPGEDLSVLEEAYAGMIPAFISEAMNKACMIALHRTGGDIEGEVTAQDLLTAADILKKHIAMTTKPEEGKNFGLDKIWEMATVNLK